MNFAVLQFPASNCDQDALHVLKDVLGQSACFIWHKENSLAGIDAVIVPGGFSYGDYLRTGAIARFAPAMKAVIEHAKSGGLVIGICNGFQILCEAHLLPGALTRNAGLHFVSRDVRLRVENVRTPWTRAYAAGQEITVPLKSGEGAYAADEATLAALESGGQVLVRYLGNPNGSARDIAGVSNEAGNVAGLMPHPEYATSELTGPGCDGLGFFASAVSALVGA